MPDPTLPAPPEPSPVPESAAAPASADPAALIDRAWDALVRAVHDRRHGFHTPVLCTLESSASGLAPDARVVVLRRVDPTLRTVIAHTDARAPKARQIQSSPSSVWVFYDPSSKMQVRARASTSLHTSGDLPDVQWQRSALSSRRCYLAPRPPGTPSDAPDVNLPEHLRDVTPSADQAAPGRANFSVMLARVHEVDVLHLAHDGHLRALARYADDGRCTSVAWLAV